MASKYPFHRDYRLVPVINQSYSYLPVAITNLLIRLERLLRFRAGPDVEIETRPIQGTRGPVRVKIFRPKGGGSVSARPCVVYFHGSGFSLTYMSSHLAGARDIAKQLDAVVVLVEYTLTNQGTFPSGFDDCYDAMVWAAEHAEELGIDMSRICVGGDSAGGAMTASVAQRALDEGKVSLRGQMLIYPVLDRTCSTPSATDFVDTPVWNAVSNKRMWTKYLEDYPEDAVPPYAAAADRGDLSGLPPAYMELAEFDPLHNEGLAYAKRLEEAGVEVDLNDTKGTVHGYDGIAPKNPVTVKAWERRFAFLRRCLAKDPAAQ